MKTIILAALLGLSQARHHQHHLGKVYRDNLIAVHSTAFIQDDNVADASAESAATEKKAAAEKKDIEAIDKKVAEAAKEVATEAAVEGTKTPKEKKAEAKAKAEKVGAEEAAEEAK